MKRKLVTVILATVLMCGSALAQRPKVGVVLSGGGAKGVAHIGALKVLEEYGIPIDMIAGTSMGALVGGLYAVGHTAAELDSIVMAQDWNHVITGAPLREEISFEQRRDDAKYLVQVPFGIDWKAAFDRKSEEKEPDPDVPGPGSPDDPLHATRDLMRLAPEGGTSGLLPMSLMGGQNIYSLLSDCTVGYHDECDFDKLPIPYACVATDLVSGKEVVFNKGVLPMAMRASMAIPGVFAPVKAEGMVLVDGGLRNNYPVDVIRAMGADIVIGVKTPSDGGDVDLDNVADMLGKVISITVAAKTEDAMADTDILIQPSIGNYGTMSFNTAALRILMDNGEKAAREAAPKLIELRKMLDEKEREHDEMFVGPMPAERVPTKATKLLDTIEISSIRFKGVSEKDEEFVKRYFKLETGKKISISDIEQAVSGLYATNAYNSVVYSLSGDHSPFGLTVTLVPNRNNRLGVGLRFDTEEISSILVDVGFNNNSLYGHRFDLSARLANYYRFGASYSYRGRNYTKFDVSYNLRHGGMRLYTDDRDKYSQLDYLQNHFEVALSTRRLRRLQIQGGLKTDIYDYRTHLDLPQIPDIYNTDENRVLFSGPFVKVGVDNLNNEWFPTQGQRLSAEVAYVTDFTAETVYAPFIEAAFSGKWVFGVGRNFAISPFMHIRALLGENIPAVMLNSYGGTQAGRYTMWQIPFYGTVGAVPAEPLLAVAGLDLRYNVYKNHYVMLTGNYARDGRSLESFATRKGVTGIRLGYSYDFIFGPLEFDVNWNSLTRGAGVYLSLGFWF